MILQHLYYYNIQPETRDLLISIDTMNTVYAESISIDLQTPKKNLCFSCVEKLVERTSKLSYSKH